MAKVRSPNYPNHSLQLALEQVRKVFAKDGRNKVSRVALAAHLGHESLSGPALGKIGALRSYGLLEGSGDEMRVSDDTITALMAPIGSDDRAMALKRLALKPTLFQDIQSEYPTRPSLETLTFWLVKQGFSATAAAIASRSYLDTLDFVSGLVPNTKENSQISEESWREEPRVGDLVQVEIAGALQLWKPAAVRAIQDHEGQKWVFVEGSETGIPMQQVIVEQKGPAAKPSTQPPTLPLEADHPITRATTRKEVFALDEGDVVLTFPDNLSASSFEDLEAYLKVFVGKMRRRAGIATSEAAREGEAQK